MNFFLRLHRSFGISFLILISCVYWTQGFRSLPWMAISYLMKDELNLSPSTSQFMTSIAFIPWSVKPLYGVLSDCVPINGSRRVAYLLISSILSIIPWLLLGFAEFIRNSSVCLISILTVQNLGAAMADVVTDAMIAEAARKERCEYAGDLQSLSWYSMALGGIFGSIAGGLAVSKVDAYGIFLLFLIFPLLQLVSSCFINEKDLVTGTTKNDGESTSKFVELPRENDSTGVAASIANEEKDEHTSSVGNLIDQEEDWVEVDAAKVEDYNEEPHTRTQNVEGDGSIRDVGPLDPFPHMGLHKRKAEIDIHEENKESTLAEPPFRDMKGELDVDKDDKKITYDAGLPFLPRIKLIFATLLQTIQQRSIWQPMLWFFLAQVCVPSLSTIMFYYQTNHLRLDASFLGMSRVVGWGALMMGTYLYNHYLKKVNLRILFGWTHIALALITLLDIILVTDINTWLGIPNKAFVLGASVLGDAVNQFKFMPFLILSVRLCPPGIEGTLFAFFMSLNNFAATLSSFFGAGLASVLHISSDDFHNLSIGICIQSLCTLIPIGFLHLIPSEATDVSS